MADSRDSSKATQLTYELAYELSYGASHEINNPLANIASRAQLLAKQLKESEAGASSSDAIPYARWQHQLGVIYAQAIRANEMIADMMYFARPPEPNRERVDLRAVLDGLAIEFSDDSTSVVIDWQTNHTTVSVDETMITAALAAIFKNSREAADPCRIHVTVETADPRINITIRDNGPGVTAPTAHRMFDPFYSGREAGRGIGFGLCKARRIIELHGGSIDWVSDDPSRENVDEPTPGWIVIVL